MAGADNEVYNTRERALSTDLNDSQALSHRWLADMFRNMFESREMPITGPPTGAVRNVVVGGLEVVPNGSDVDVQPGALWQDSAALAPVPGTFDSTYRIGISRATTNVVMPSPGADSYVLIEAQMVRVVSVTDTRDIFDPGIPGFVPTLVDKVAERRLAFQITTQAASVPTPTGGDWVAIAVVFRPAGGGAVGSNDIIDMRALANDFFVASERLVSEPGRPVSIRMATDSVPGTPTDFVDIQRIIADLDGRRGYYVSFGGLPVDITVAPIAESGFATAADTWFYLYMAPWEGLHLPANFSRSVIHASRGLLVLSAQDTLQHTLDNNGPITPSAPWNSSPIATGRAYIVGAFRRNAADTGWLWQQSRGDGQVDIEPINVDSWNATVANPRTVSMATFVPTIARTARIRISTQGTGGGTTNQTLSVQPVGAGGTIDYARAPLADWTNANGWEFHIPLDTTLSFDVLLSGAARPTLVRVDLIGYSV